MEENLYEHIQKFSPKDWAELARSAKAIREIVTNWLLTSSLDHRQSLYTNFSLLSRVYLGALYLHRTLAITERDPGDFDNLTPCIDRALITGEPIFNFIDASIEILGIDMGFFASDPHAAMARSMAVDQIFDGHRQIMRAAMDSKFPFSLDDKVVVKIIRDEKGILPKAIENIIVDAIKTASPQPH